MSIIKCQREGCLNWTANEYACEPCFEEWDADEGDLMAWAEENPILDVKGEPITHIDQDLKKPTVTGEGRAEFVPLTTIIKDIVNDPNEALEAQRRQLWVDVYKSADSGHGMLDRKCGKADDALKEFDERFNKDNKGAE